MSRPMLLFDRLFSAANGRLCSLRGTLLVAAVLLVTAGETIAQSTSVLEWSFGTTTYTNAAQYRHAAVSTNPVSLAVNPGSGLTTTSMGTSSDRQLRVGSFNSAETAMTTGRTSTSPLANAKVLYTTFVMGSAANADLSSLAVQLKYQRTATTSPTKVRAYLTWLESGTTYRTRYSSAMTLSGTSWTALDLPLNQGTAAPASINDKTFLIELHFWSVSNSSNTINLDDIKLLCGSMSSTWAMTPAALSTWPQNKPYWAQFAVPGYGSAITWSRTGSLPAGLSFDSVNGRITGTPTGTGTFAFSVTASGSGLTQTKNYSLSVTAPPSTPPSVPAIVKWSWDGDTGSTTFQSLPAADVNAALAEVSYGYDGTGTLSGSLQSGGTTSTSNSPINLAAGGKMRGFFGQEAIHGYADTRNSLLHFNSGANNRFNVYPAANTASIPTASQTGTGESAALQFRLKFDPNAVGDLKAMYLPPGMSFNATTRAITGTPSAPGTYTFTITATDANGCPGSTTYNLVINCPAIAVAPASVAGGTVNAAYTQTFTASGGNGSYTWSVIGGSLPLGLTLSPGGVLSGVPTMAGSSNFTVQARDANGCLGSKAYAMTVVSLKIGNQVWSDLNNNGFKDSGEPGVSGVVVQLWKAGVNGIQENGGGDDVQVGVSTVTNASGIYGFVDVAPASGYYLRLPAPPPANAMSSAVAMTQDDGVDGDNNGVQIGGPGSAVRSPLFTLAPGTEPGSAVDGDDANGDQTLDFGLVQTVCVGNLVFKDVNNNGTYEAATDLPAAGVIVKLFNQGADPLSSLPVASMTTGSDGLYLFSVRPGSFFLYVAADQFVSGAPLYGTKPTKGRSDTAVPNIDDNGDQNALVTSKPMATGVRTGNFTLAIAAQPTAASGETGHQSTSDDSYDAQANLTVDLGFYPLSGASAPLAGVVRRDLAQAATAPLPGVEVALYEDANSNGSLDTPEMQAVQSVVTDDAGGYAFEAVLPGDYLVVQSVLPGAEATFDTDGGAADVTRVTLEGEGITGVDFHQALVEDTFAQWQQKNPLSGSNAVHENPDVDLYDNLLEYALGTAADEGQATKRFYLEAGPGGRIDAVLVRGSTGHADVAYGLESSATGTTWTKVNAVPVATQNNDGTETLRFANVGGTQGFIRLKVALDVDHNGTAEATAWSPVHAFHQHTFAAGTQTFSMPLLKAELYAGRGGGDLSSVLSGHYVEPMDTSRVVVRPHWTVQELFPAAAFTAGATSGEADRLLFFDSGKYRVLWLLATQTGARWVREGDAALADAGGTVLRPGEGLLVHVRSGSVTLPFVGQVRSWPFVQSLRAGTQLVGAGYPVASSPSQRGMSTGFAEGSRVQLWVGDATAGGSGYVPYLLQQGEWRDSAGLRANDTPLFHAFRAAFITTPTTITDWSQPLPWNP